MKLFLWLLWLQASMALAACDLSDRLTRQGGIIHDRLSQLEWQACSLGSQWQEGKGCVGTPALLTLLEAKDEAARLGEGWRLPTIEEMPELVYYIDFIHGVIDGHTDRFAQAARLVRSRP